MRSCIFLSILISLNFFIETVNAKVINTTDMFLIRQEVLKLTNEAIFFLNLNSKIVKFINFLNIYKITI